MKIAILLCGHIRTWENCKNNFLKTFDSKNHEVSVFVHTYSNKYGYHPYIVKKLGIPDNIDNEKINLQIFNHARYKTVTVEEELIEDDVPDLDEYPVNLDIYSQIRKVRLCNKSRKTWCLENNIKYDIIIKTRMDILYDVNFIIPENIENNTIYIPQCLETLFPSDVCYMGNEDVMNKLIETLSSKYNKKIINPHTWLSLNLQDLNCIQLSSTLKVNRYTKKI